MNTLISERTPLLIAAEINTIKHQSRRIVLASAIEIGRRLKEAKALLKHGEWGNWLKESVYYSQRTADYLMQLYEEYGPKILASSDSIENSNSQPVANLTYTQALILLGLPEEERNSFITENHVDNMSVRELQQAVRERDQALQEKQQALLEKEHLQKDLNLKNSEIIRLTTQARSLEQLVQDYKVKDSDQESVILKQSEPATAKEEILPVEKTAEQPSAVQKADAQFNIHRGNMGKSYEELLKMLTSLARTDPKLKEKYRQEAKKTLDNMASMLEVWPPVVKSNLKIDQR